MPRPNRPRSLGSERSLARRVQLLCSQRGWKYPELAERMTAAGCPIQTSALYKMHSDPPRRVTVDEFVAMANVFDIDPEDLLRPVEVVEQEWAEDVARDLVGAASSMDDAQAELVRAALRLAEVGRSSPDLFEFITNLYKTASPARQWFAEFVGMDSAGEEHLDQLARLGNAFWEEVLALIESQVARTDVV